MVHSEFCQATATIQNHKIKRAEQGKIRLYGLRNFAPMVVEDKGRVSEKFKNTMGKVFSRNSHRLEASKEFFQKISVTLQRANAELILTSNGDAEERIDDG